MRLKADLVLLLVAVLWGSAFVAQRTAAILGSVYFFNGARFLVAGLLLLPFAFRSRFKPRQIAWMCVAGAALFAGSALQQAGLKDTTAGNAGFLTSLYVVLVPLVLFVGWREPPRPLSLVAVALATLGAFFLSGADRFRVRPGDVLELSGAALWALHVVVLGKYASRYDAVAFSAGQIIIASALNWVAAASLEPWVVPVPPALVQSIAYTAVASLALGYTLQIWGQRHTPPTDAALILSLEAVFAAIGGYVILAERLTVSQFVGCAVIVLAVLLSQVTAWGRISARENVAQARKS